MVRMDHIRFLCSSTIGLELVTGLLEELRQEAGADGILFLLTLPVGFAPLGALSLPCFSSLIRAT